MTADEYDMAQRVFRIRIRPFKTFVSLGGSGVPATTTWKVQTIFGERLRTKSLDVYEAAPITVNISMNEERARAFSKVALRFGCPRGDCPADNIVADIVYRLDGYRKVGNDCSAGECSAHFEYVYKLLGVRLTVAEGATAGAMKAGEVVLETVYEKPPAAK